MEVQVEIRFDQEAGIYFVANSNLKGLHVEAATLDEMKQEILAATRELLQSRFSGDPPKTNTKIIMHSAAHCAA